MIRHMIIPSLIVCVAFCVGSAYGEALEEAPGFTESTFIAQVEGDMLPGFSDEALGYVEFLDTCLESEGRDVWADEMERQIPLIFQQDRLAGSDLVGVSCGMTICRIEIEHESIDQYMSFSEAFPSFLPEHSQGYGGIFSLNPLRSLLYISRIGHELPEIVG